MTDDERMTELLCEIERKILEVLPVGAGIETGQVARRVDEYRYARAGRQFSKLIRPWLVKLKAEGFVELLDDQKPDCWMRTEAGTKALNSKARTA